MTGLDSYSRQFFLYLFGPHFDLYQSLNRLPIWNLQNCSMLPLAFVAGWLQGHWWGFISRNYVVWPTFFLMNVSIALKGSHFWFLFFLKDLISDFYLYSNRSFLWPWCWLHGSLQNLSRQLRDHPEFDRQPGVSLGFPVSWRCGLEHELVDYEASILSTKKPDRRWLTLGGFPDGLPDVALVDADFSGLWEVKVFGSGVAIVADKLNFTSDSVATKLVFAAVVNVLTGDVPQDDRTLEDLFQFSHIIDSGAGFVDSLLPLLYSLALDGR